MAKRARLSAAVKGALAASVRKGRRETIYRMLKRRNAGHVPCFVCGRHVEECDATLEHIKPLAKGGTDDMANLSISHWKCNNERGCKANA